MSSIASWTSVAGTPPCLRQSPLINATTMPTMSPMTFATRPMMPGNDSGDPKHDRAERFDRSLERVRKVPGRVNDLVDARPVLRHEP
jgi:hypothetical protein